MSSHRAHSGEAGEILVYRINHFIAKFLLKPETYQASLHLSYGHSSFADAAHRIYLFSLSHFSRTILSTSMRLYRISFIFIRIIMRKSSTQHDFHRIWK